MSEHSKIFFSRYFKICNKALFGKGLEIASVDYSGIDSFEEHAAAVFFSSHKSTRVPKKPFSLSFLHKLLGYMMVLEAAVMDR